MKQILLSLFISIFVITVKSQNIYIYKIDGSSEQYALNNVQKITYGGNSMILKLNNGATHTWDINDIDKYSYKELSPIRELNSPDFYFAISPNPFEDNITLSNTMRIDKILNIEILNTVGEVVYENKLSGYEVPSYQIKDLEELTSGIYFIKVSSDKSLFVKKIIKK